jgi:hypothetical protein
VPPHADTVVGDVHEILFDAEVAFRRLDTRMAEEELDLLQFPAPGTGRVWRKCGADRSRLIPRKLQLQRNIAVLFPPEGNERRLQPAPERSEPMHARMAGGTERNQQARRWPPWTRRRSRSKKS